MYGVVCAVKSSEQCSPCVLQAAVGACRLLGQVQPDQRLCGAQPPPTRPPPPPAAAAPGAGVDVGGASSHGGAGGAWDPALPRAAAVQHTVG